MRIRFLRDEIYEQGGPGKGPKFAAGFVLDAADVQKVLGLSEAPTDEWTESFLKRWVQRRAAEVVDGRTPASEPVEAAANVDAPLPDDLEKLTRAELNELAVTRGVDISDAHNKADVIAALELAAETEG